MLKKVMREMPSEGGRIHCNISIESFFDDFLGPNRT